MKKILFFFLLVLFVVNRSSATLFPISAPTGICVGTSGLVYDSTGGGTWSSSDVSVATVGSVIGHYAYVAGLSAGSATITYTYGGSYVTTLIVVSPAPAPIVGPDSICTGSSVACTDAVSGGTWSIDWSSTISIGSTTGVVTGITDGAGYIYYTMGPGCYAEFGMMSVSTYAGGLAGSQSVCLGSTITLTDSVVGTTWSSSDPSIASVSSSGDVSGVTAGIATISYAVSGACGTTYATLVVTVNTTTFPGTISGASSLLVGTSSSLSESVPSGAWSSSDATIASVGSTYWGYATLAGVSAGTATITYSVMGCSGLATAIFPVTVNALNGISGYVHFSDPYVGGYYGPVKVWLITYDPGSSSLQAIDSTVVTSSGSSAYYQFTGVPTDSLRIKASVNTDTSTATTGYMPTYRDSSYYWHDANVLWHVSGASDINRDIWMLYGSTHTGPGFIAGDVTTGANRGTSASAPAVGICMYLLNSAGIQVQQAYTNALGHYSFINLPVGTSYTVFPEALNYATTPFTGISLTSASPSMSGAGFIQHTLSHTITPMTEAVAIITKASSVNVFPNPTTGNIFIQWANKATGSAAVTITDVTGRVVGASTISINATSGQSQLNVSNLNNGIYLISIKGESVNYDGKIMVQH